MYVSRSLKCSRPYQANLAKVSLTHNRGHFDVRLQTYIENILTDVREAPYPVCTDPGCHPPDRRAYKTNYPRMAHEFLQWQIQITTPHTELLTFGPNIGASYYTDTTLYTWNESKKRLGRTYNWKHLDYHLPKSLIPKKGILNLEASEAMPIQKEWEENQKCSRPRWARHFFNTVSNWNLVKGRKPKCTRKGPMQWGRTANNHLTRLTRKIEGSDPAASDTLAPSPIGRSLTGRDIIIPKHR